MPASKIDDKDYDKLYKKMNLREQIMHRPDTYVGSLERATEKMWVFNADAGEMEMQTISYVPGLYKIFDEILVNAADNKERDEKQSKIKVDINAEKGFVKVWNDGEGVPVHMHKKHDLYIPDMIFGHILTSSNYDDDQQKTTGGRNGFGAKLANIFSTAFTVETSHSGTGLKFKKTWKKNMSQSDEASITKIAKSDKDFTCVTFYPDFKRLNMPDGFDDDTVALFEKRVIDIGGVTDKSLKVYLNGKATPVQEFKSYVDLFPGLGEEKMKDSYACPHPRWQICIRPSNIDYQQVSFVNSIWTMKGGQHVNLIVNQVVAKITETMKKKNKKIDITANNVKPFLWIFVNSKIVNPAFDSQTKETLITPKSKFGSAPEVPQKMIDALCKVISERILDRVNNKINRQMAAKVAGAGRSRLVNVPKLDDANDAGTKKGHLCTLILTEGDSAKSMVTAGLGKLGRDRFGCFPLRGKLLNVREKTSKQIQENKEIENLMKIIGLKPGVKYRSTEDLRYGSVMIMTDQDYDGSHIKGLLVNLFHTMWRDLLAIPGFLVQFITPIVKAFPVSGKKRDEDAGVSFFTIPDFVKFKEEQQALGKRWEFKYYKGLGTSNTKEAKEYFENLATHKVDFVYEEGEDDRNIELAFVAKRADDRKRWITGYRPGDWIDYNIKQLGYTEFINKELILFSIADCERSLPSVVDGLKPGHRKILYAAFKRNLTREVKVAQFSGYVSEHAAYHHGEASLQGTIVGMAQNYTGSNNLPLLVPCGMFGSRANGGKDHASARYIFTRLDPITRLIYPKVDDNLLVYKDDDGFPVEPEYYVPIIPTALLNGCVGIGTGFATQIPAYNPQDLVDGTRDLIAGRELRTLVPWCRGHTGNIRTVNEGKHVSEGVIEVVDSSVVRITELPVKKWTDDYKDMLAKMQEKGLIIEIRHHNTGDRVDMDVAVAPDILARLQAENSLTEFFDLADYIHSSNMICFDPKHTINRYKTPQDIMKEWYLIRLDLYHARKGFLRKELTKTCEKLLNMVRFINEVNAGKLKIQNVKKTELLVELKKGKYKHFFPEQKRKTAKTAVAGDTEEDNDTAAEAENTDPTDKYFTAEKEAAPADPKGDQAGYEYLLSMRLWSLTYERARQLEEQLKNAQNDLAVLEKTSEKDMWLADLDTLEKQLKITNQKWQEEMKDAPKAQGSKAPARGRKKEASQTRLTEKAVKAPKRTQEMEKALNAEFDKLEKKRNTASKEKAKGAKAAAKRKASEMNGDGDGASPDLDESVSPAASPAKRRKVDATAKPAAKKAPAKKAAAKKAATKRKRRGSTETSYSEVTSSSDVTSSVTSEETSLSASDDESSESTVPTRKRAKKAAPKVASPTKAAPKVASPTKAAPKKASPKKVQTEAKTELESPASKKKAMMSALFDDDDDDILNFDPSSFGLKKSSPAKKPAAKKPAAKKRSNVLVDDDSDDDLKWDP
eukprot:TRINITY_DN3757_c0_g2_i1.p1 TRINITY_DN3757_c0_g2~~TRINITY_DN3757_c0_g2_i1.p1  ORF type:complete len:1459 (+),score=601.91 TRINITY_DN3757_c0_g2_i1:101-4477(+)